MPGVENEELSLRDRIALRAMDGMMRDPNFRNLVRPGSEGKLIGRICYGIADSLLEARGAKATNAATTKGEK